MGNIRARSLSQRLRGKAPSARKSVAEHVKNWRKMERAVTSPFMPGRQKHVNAVARKMGGRQASRLGG